MIEIVSYRAAKRKLIAKEKKDENLEGIVREIIGKVRERGDNALVELTRKFDFKGMGKNKLKVKNSEIKAAYKKVDKKTISAIKSAKMNIEKFAREQVTKGFVIESEKGVKVGELVKPLDSAGIYVPAGGYPLVSSVLMNAVPAKVAGVPKIVMCCPPNKAGEIDPNVLVAADIAGVDKVFRVGGAQAIAAMAYGTASIPKVCKVVGPGNKFVTEAKRQVFGAVGIDMLAGPSEVMVVARKGNANWIAADLLAQAEHDVEARAILVTASRELAWKVQKEVKEQLRELKTKEIAEKAIRKKSMIVLVKNKEQAFELVNEVAPEHLEVIGFGKSVLKKVRNVGAIFFGEYSCEVLGDYCSGTNHVLPTAGFAKVRGGLSAADFLKVQSFQEVSKRGFLEIANIAEKLAEIEGLEAHKKAVEMRRR